MAIDTGRLARHRRYAENWKMFPEAAKYADSVGLKLVESKRFGAYELSRRGKWGLTIGPAWQEWGRHSEHCPQPVFDGQTEWNLFDFIAAMLEVDTDGRTDGTTGAIPNQPNPENVPVSGKSAGGCT